MNIQASQSRHSTKSTPVFQPPNSRSVATDLMQNRSIPTDDHLFLQGNIGHYVSKLPRAEQRTEKVERLLDRLDEKEILPPEIARWTIKISRDLKSSYTDPQVKERAESLNRDLKMFMGHYPRQVYIVGGVAENRKGRSAARFGGDSDLDIVGVGLLSQEGTEALRSQGWEVSLPNSEISQVVKSPDGLQGLLYPTQAETDKALDWFGQHLKLRQDEDFDVVAWIREGSCSRGIPLDWCQGSEPLS